MDAHRSPSATDRDADEIWSLSAARIARLVRQKELSPTEVLDSFSERILTLEPKLHSFATLTLEEAGRDARDLERRIVDGEDCGALSGVPIAIKDMILRRGVRTTFGSSIYEDFFPEHDEPVVTRLKASGALLVGNTNVPELGFASVGHNALFETTRNPWNLRMTPGGSSSGSGSAVAARQCPVALGTDRAGSIRIPSALCGIVGFKPSAGVVPGDGNQDAMTVIGPMARSMEDVALLMETIVAYDSRDLNSIPFAPGTWQKVDIRAPGNLRIGFSEDLGYAAVDPQVRSLVRDAVERLTRHHGWTLEEWNPQWPDPWRHWSALAMSSADLVTIRSHMRDNRERMIPRLVTAMERNRSIEDVADANKARRHLGGCVADAFDRFDVLMTPTVAVPAFEIHHQGPEKIDGRIVDPGSWIPFTFPFNMTGNPALSMPVGLTNEGLPVGLQIVAPRFEDGDLVTIGRMVEEAGLFEGGLPSGI